MTQLTTVEVLPNGTVKIIGAAEYESSAVVKQVLDHMATVNKQNRQAEVLNTVLPWLAVSPVFLVFFALIHIMFKPAPAVEYNPQGGIHVQQAS
jgi:hypothetical protein